MRWMAVFMSVWLVGEPGFCAWLPLQQMQAAALSVSDSPVHSIYQAQAFELPILSEILPWQLFSGTRRARHEEAQLALNPLYLESGSWWGRLYGNYKKGDAHIRSISQDLQYKRDSENLEKLFPELKKMGWVAAKTALETLITGPAAAFAEFIASTAGIYMETKQFMQNIDKAIEIRRGKGLKPVDSIEAIAQSIAANEINDVVERHDLIYFKGRTKTEKASPAVKESMRVRMTSWASDRLQSYIERRLKGDDTDEGFADSSRALFEALFYAHRRLNRITNPIEPWDYAEYVMQESVDPSGKKSREFLEIPDVTTQPKPPEIGYVWVKEGAIRIRQVAKTSVTPLLKIGDLPFAFRSEVNATTTIGPALQSGWLFPDIPSGDGVPADFFFPENIDAYRDLFVLAYPREKVLDLKQLSKELGKDPARIYDLIDAGRLKPVQEIWLEDGTVMPYFLESDLMELKKQFAPEKIDRAFRVSQIAVMLKAPERVVALALAEKRLPFERVGPVGNPYYIVPEANLAGYRELFQQKPLPEETELRFERADVVDVPQLAAAVGKPTTELVWDWVRIGELTPAQNVLSENGRKMYYFPIESVPLYINIFAPTEVKHAYTLQDLADKLVVPRRTLEEALDDGLVVPEAIIGSPSRPYYVVRPQSIPAMYRLLHLQESRISVNALVEKHRTDADTIRSAMAWARIPVRTRIYSGTLTRSIAVMDEARLVAALRSRRKRMPEQGDKEGIHEWLAGYEQRVQINSSQAVSGPGAKISDDLIPVDALAKALGESRQSLLEKVITGAAQPVRMIPPGLDPEKGPYFLIRDFLMDVDEIAQITGRSRRAVLRRVGQGPLKSVYKVELPRDARPYFLRSEQGAYIRLIAPENLPDTYTPAELANKLRTAPEVARAAIRDGTLHFREVLGTPEKPVYVASELEFVSMREQLKRRTADRGKLKPDESKLRFPRKKLLNTEEMASELGVPSVRVLEWVHEKILNPGPAQSLQVGRRGSMHYFWQKYVERYRAQRLPHMLPYAYKRKALAAAMDSTVPQLKRALKKLADRPKQLGRGSQSVLIVPPDMWEALREALHPSDRQEHSLYELSKKWNYRLRIMLDKTAEWKFPMRIGRWANRPARYVAVNYQGRLKARLAKVPGIKVRLPWLVLAASIGGAAYMDPLSRETLGIMLSALFHLHVGMLAPLLAGVLISGGLQAARQHNLLVTETHLYGQYGTTFKWLARMGFRDPRGLVLVYPQIPLLPLRRLLAIPGIRRVVRSEWGDVQTRQLEFLFSESAVQNPVDILLAGTMYFACQRATFVDILKHQKDQGFSEVTYHFVGDLIYQSVEPSAKNSLVQWIGDMQANLSRARAGNQSARDALIRASYAHDVLGQGIVPSLEVNGIPVGRVGRLDPQRVEHPGRTEGLRVKLAYWTTRQHFLNSLQSPSKRRIQSSLAIAA